MEKIASEKIDYGNTFLVYSAISEKRTFCETVPKKEKKELMRDEREKKGNGRRDVLQRITLFPYLYGTHHEKMLRGISNTITSVVSV